VWLEGDTYVAHAWPIDVASCGGSEQHALSMLAEAVQAFVVVTREMGTLDTILEEAGYTLIGQRLVPPLVTHCSVTTDITT
jgi:hypothetical protein